MDKIKDKMKEIIVLYLTILLTGCGNAHSVYEGLAEEDWQWITFDVEKFNSNKSDHPIPTYQYTEEDGTIIFMAYQQEIFRLTVRHPDSTIFKTYRYYPDGKLLGVNSSYSKGGILIDKGFRYDKKGNLTEVIDYDKPFKYSLENIREFLQEQNIPNATVHRTTTGFLKEEEFEEEHKMDGKQILWKIISRDQGIETVFVIDGITGDVLIKEEFFIHI